MTKKHSKIPGSATVDKTDAVRPGSLPQPNVDNPVRPTNRDVPTQSGPGTAT